FAWRPARPISNDTLASRAVRPLPRPPAPFLGFEMLLVAIIDERIEPVDRLHDHVAALAAVAAVRPAELDESLAPERHAAVAAVARADVHLGFIEEFHDARYAITDAKYEAARKWSLRATQKNGSQKACGKGSIRGEGPGRAMPH